MKLNKTLIPIGALAIALGAGSLSATAAERDGRRDREHREGGGSAREHSGGDRDRGSRDRGSFNRDERHETREFRNVPERPREFHNAPERSREFRNAPERPREFRNLPERRGEAQVRPGNRGENRGYGYAAPRFMPERQAPRHFYGPGGHSSAYFWWGSGYRYGAPYSGRVFGYAAPPAYGVRVEYGDVRVQVRPRDAAVYVDGYYAGIVDDFDGIFQRLTLTVGPHQVEIEAPGFEPQTFDVYVDPTRTVDLRGDLFPLQR